MGSIYEIKDGLEIGEEVVTNGAFVIDASAQLNNRTSMMNKNVGIKGGQAAVALPDYTASTPESFKQQLHTVVQSYVKLKDALVATDPGKTSKHAAELITKVSTVDMKLLKGDAHMYWMEKLKAIDSHAKGIEDSKDVEVQRKQFEFLSQAVIESVMVFGIDNDTYYVLHCPMVNNNKGADWLSHEKEVLNPYFGEKMLSCGWVKDTLGI